MFAMSSGSPERASGWTSMLLFRRRSTAAATRSGSAVEMGRPAASGVAMYPGQTAFARTSNSASSSAAAFVSITTPALATL